MTRIRIGGAVLLAVLGAGLLTRITNRAGVPSGNPATVPQAKRGQTHFRESASARSPH